MPTFTVGLEPVGALELCFRRRPVPIRIAQSKTEGSVCLGCLGCVLAEKRNRRKAKTSRRSK
jgi:hypothetical protein